MLVLIGVIVGAVLTSGLGLAGEFVRRRWTRDDERARRVEERSDEAAIEIAALIDGGLCKPLYGCINVGSGPDPAVFEEPARAIERRVLLLNDKAVGRRLEGIVTCILRSPIIEQQLGHSPSRIGHQLRREGREAIASLLRRDPVPESPIVDEYLSVIADDDAFHAEMAEKERERRRHASDDQG